MDEVRKLSVKSLDLVRHRCGREALAMMLLGHLRHFAPRNACHAHLRQRRDLGEFGPLATLERIRRETAAAVLRHPNRRQLCRRHKRPAVKLRMAFGTRLRTPEGFRHLALHDLQKTSCRHARTEHSPFLPISAFFPNQNCVSAWCALPLTRGDKSIAGIP